jgi:hypothetical protein
MLTDVLLGRVPRQCSFPIEYKRTQNAARRSGNANDNVRPITRKMRPISDDHTDHGSYEGADCE